MSALKGGGELTSSLNSGFGANGFGLFDARRFGDLTPLERMTAGMIGGATLDSLDADMIDATPSPLLVDEMAMDIEEL